MQKQKNSRALHYLAYLVRLRRNSDATPWWVTVENPHTNERWNFTKLAQFIRFLEEQTGEQLVNHQDYQGKRGEDAPDKLIYTK